MNHLVKIWSKRLREARNNLQLMRMRRKLMRKPGLLLRRLLH
jgi:hypothetical protein